MSVRVYICSQCGKGFTSEAEILDHQSHFQALHRVDPEIDEHDGSAWGGAEIVVGETYTWQPQHPTARARLCVTAIEGDRLQMDGEYWTDLADFVSSVWQPREISSGQRVRIVVAERELGLEQTELHDGLADALRDGLGSRHRYKTRDDMELLILNIIETRALKRTIATLLERKP